MTYAVQDIDAANELKAVWRVSFNDQTGERRSLEVMAVDADEAWRKVDRHLRTSTIARPASSGPLLMCEELRAGFWSDAVLAGDAT